MDKAITLTVDRTTSFDSVNNDLETTTPFHEQLFVPKNEKLPPLHLALAKLKCSRIVETQAKRVTAKSKA